MLGQVLAVFLINKKGVCIMPRYNVPLEELEEVWEETDLDTDTIIASEGWHLAEVKDFEVRPGNAAPYIAWRFEVAGENSSNGLAVWDNTSLSPKGIWKFKSLATAANLLLTKEISLNEHLQALIGRQVAIEVSHEDWNGKKQAKISSYAVSTEFEKALPGAAEEVASDEAEEIPF
jgi:hypothetical protein